MMRALFLLLLAAPIAHAQVSGHVVDARTQVPIVGAAVRIGDGGSAADDEGRFSLNVAPGRYLLTVSALGYEPLRDSVTVRAGMEPLLIRLVQIALHVDEVVVTSARRAQRAFDAPTSIAVLRRAELAAVAPMGIGDALRTMPGVQVAGNQVNVRGSSGFSYNTGSRVLFLLDGVPLLSPDSDGVPLELIPSAAIERIEVTRGPGSALYGGSALGGVIQVVTRDAPSELFVEASIQAGAHLGARHASWREAWRGGDQSRPYGEATLSLGGSSDRVGW